MHPAKVQQLLQNGLSRHQAGRLAEAETLYRQARTAAPKSFDAFNLSGLLAYQQARYTDAAALFAQAFKIDPKSAIAQMRLGLALAALGRHPEAERHYRASLRLDAKIPETWNNLAVSLKALGQLSEAGESYRQAISLRPDYYDAHDRLGALLADSKGLPAGIPHFRRAVELKPDYATGWCNLGLALISDHQFTEALTCLNRALTLDPKLTQATVGRGLALQQTYRLEQAAAEYGAALTRQPQHHEARSARLLTLNYLSGISREALFEEHLAFGRVTEGAAGANPPPPLPNSREPERRLRLAFLSPDLRSHSVAYFLEPLLRHLDRNAFEVYLYHDHFQVDAMSDKLRAHARLWRNFVGQQNNIVEAAIRSDAPDVLVDLAGHTGYNRLSLFARRLAPVQISYLGYPNTTGLRAMDYRLVDAITDPDADDDRLHTEKLIRFAPTAWAYEPPAAAPEPAIERKPDPAAITFGSFNNFAKVSPETLQLWGRVLQAVPASRLLLKGHDLDSNELRSVVQQKLQLLGVDPTRIELLGRTSNVQSHLATYARVDIALDSFPYHGTTTTCEALWMGVPVLTLRGDRHAARVSTSILTAVGHPEWIAGTEEEYVEKAASLAGSSEALVSNRRLLREQMRSSPLLDHAGQTKRFADAIRTCWQRWCENTSL